MATDRRAWAAERTWAIKGISDRTRAAALEAAHEAGLTVGAWLEQVLARAAKEVRHPKPPAAGMNMAELINERLRPIEEELHRLSERVAALEEQVGRVAAPEPPAETAAPPSPAEEPQARERAETSPARGRRRELPEDARERIDELHGAGRSMYAISKELDVPYSTVYAYVKKSRGRQAQA
jgi:hypothetical protein